MLELIFMACSLLNGNACKTVTLSGQIAQQAFGVIERPIYADAHALNAVSCAKLAEIEMSKWLTEHPNWITGRGFKCQPAGMMAKA